MDKKYFIYISMALMLLTIFFLAVDDLQVKTANQRFFKAYQEQGDYFVSICDINIIKQKELEILQRNQDLNKLLTTYMYK